MKEIYEAINAETVKEDYIVINSSKQRELYFEVTFAFVLLLPLSLMFVTYNINDTVGLLLTCFMIGLVIVLHFKKASLCYKKVIFNRKLGEIKIKQGFPLIDETIKSSEVVFKEFNSEIKNDKYDNLVLEHNKRRYRIFQVAEGVVPPNFLQDYMKPFYQSHMPTPEGAPEQQAGDNKYWNNAEEEFHREPESEMYDPNVHMGWGKIKYSNSTDESFENTYFRHNFEDGRIIYMKTDSEGNGYLPPAGEKYSLMIMSFWKSRP